MVDTACEDACLPDQPEDGLQMTLTSIRTEQAYAEWIKRYIWSHGRRHPSSSGADDVEAFLSHLASDRDVVLRTRQRALYFFFIGRFSASNCRGSTVSFAPKRLLGSPSY